jgi:hypothetical protein
MKPFIYKGAKSFFLIFLILPALLLSCGGGGGTGTPDGTGPDGIPTTGDVVILSVDGGANGTYTEAHDPVIECNPRVDWFSNQVLLFDNYTGAGPYNGFEMFFDIMFAVTDAVGTYAISADPIQVVLGDSTGTTYTANQILDNSSGTVEVTRSDTRIEGTFNVVLVDASGNPGTGPTLTGSFGVDAGASLSCP